MRVIVGVRCEQPCTSCRVCDRTFVAPSLAEVTASVGDTTAVTLGGGDATRWPDLEAFLAARTSRRVAVEAPFAALLERGVVARLARLGVAEVIAALDVTRIHELRIADRDIVTRIAAMERLGLVVSLRLSARPIAFARVAALAAALLPRISRIELVRQDVGKQAIALEPKALLPMLGVPGTVFAGDRSRDAGYLPPCALPTVHASRPDVWDEVLSPRSTPNRTLVACATCSLADRCHFTDASALAGVPSATKSKLTSSCPDVLCLEPWLKMELTDPAALVHQCCSDWTIGARGDRSVSTLREIWNGEGYRAARRAMLHGSVSTLCRPICPRVHDRSNEASRFMIIPGSPAFVRNQELMLEDLALGRDELRSMPLNLGLCPSTYCNFDCIMCGYGRTPRRDIPDDVWDELPHFLPTLSTLVLLGGEPLANPRTMSFLRNFDSARWPDTGISLTTNGSFLTRATLRHLTRCRFASIIVSLNAGDAATYDAVQRGTSFELLLENLDALVEFRAAQPRQFDLRAGFVVQPANANSLIEFGELTKARGLGIRLLPLHANPSHNLDFYEDADEVARVLASLDGFAVWATARQPDWLMEIGAIRSAIAAEVVRARAASSEPSRTRLPLLS